jgi:hypothetical protein
MSPGFTARISRLNSVRPLVDLPETFSVKMLLQGVTHDFRDIGLRRLPRLPREAISQVSPERSRLASFPYLHPFVIAPCQRSLLTGPEHGRTSAATLAAIPVGESPAN